MTEIFVGQPRLDEKLPDFTFDNDLPVVAGYLRVSSDTQVEDGHSLETQPVHIREACERRFPDGCNIIWIADEGLSGTLPYIRDGLKRSQYRPGLTLVTDLITQGLVQYVCVYKCNRLCRSLRIWLEFEEDYLQKYNAEFFSATEPVDNRTIAGKFIADLLMATSSYERDQILQVTTHGLQARRAAGYLMGDVSYGWEWEDCNLLARKERRNIRPVIEQVKVVRQIIRWFLTGHYIPWIIKQLEEQGIPTGNGKQKWCYQTVLDTLLNPVHCGYIINAEGKYERGVHYDLRIIEESTYWAIIQRREDTATVPTGRRPLNGLFSELGRCGVCGARMRIRDIKDHEPRYECRARSSETKHKCFQITISDVDKWVIQCIQSTFASLELMELSRQELARITDEGNGGLETAQTHFTEDIERINEESRSWDKLYSSGEIDDTTYEMYAEELLRESETLHIRLTNIAKQLERSGAKQARLEFALNILDEFHGAFEALDRDEKLGLAWSVIDELVFQPNGDYVDIRLQFICGGTHVLQLPAKGAWVSKIGRLSVSCLTTAYYLLHGYDGQDIIEARSIPSTLVDGHIWSIMHAACSDNLEVALELVKPVVEKRESELLIGQTFTDNEYKKGETHPRRVPGVARIRKEISRELTESEIYLLKILAAGHIQRIAAEMLSCSILELETSLKGIFRKLDVQTTKEALAICLKRGIVDQIESRIKLPTQNELSYMRDIASGKPRREMAAERGIQQICIKTRFSKMYRKFGVKGVDGLLKLFSEKGWL